MEREKLKKEEHYSIVRTSKLMISWEGIESHPYRMSHFVESRTKLTQFSIFLSFFLI